MNDNKKRHSFSDLKGIHKAVPIILISSAIFIAVCLFIEMGTLGDGIRALFRGLFSWGAATIPVALIAHAVCYPTDLAEKRVVPRLIFSIVAVILLSSVDYAIFSWGGEPAFTPGKSFAAMENGGFIGCVLGFALSKLLGQLGVIIFVSAVLLIYTTFFYAEKAGSVGALAISIMNWFKKTASDVKDKHEEYTEKQKQLKEDREQHQREVTSQELIDDEFFKAKGENSDIKIKELGIEENAKTHGLSPLVDPKKRIVEEPPAAPAEPEKKRKRAEKPLDLSYGLEENPPAQEEKKTEEEAPKNKEYNNAFFGIDESADSVFTNDFDPFDFATSEKASAKYASRVAAKSAVTEEIDEMTLYEMRANHEPTEREKRRIELERKKQEWMAKNGRTAPKAPAAPVNPAPVTPAPAPAPTPAPAATFAPTVPTPPPAVPTSQPVSFGVNTPGYSSPKPTNNQPIKTVEFTITKGPQPAPAAPLESEPVNLKLEKPAPAEDKAEDIAILIAQRIAKSNPAYARSANDLKVYTKVIPDENDELYRQLNGIGTPAQTDVLEEIHNAEAPISATSEESADRDEYLLDDGFTIEEEPKSEEGLTTEEEATFEELPTPEENIPEQPEVFEEDKEEEKAAPQPMPSTQNIHTGDLEFSIGEEKEKIFEPSAQSTYQRAAGFASVLVNEAADVAEFKPYAVPAPSVNIQPSLPSQAEEKIRVERTMLPPTVAAASEPVVPATAPEQTIEEPTANIMPEEKEEVLNSLQNNAPSAPEEIAFTPTAEPEFNTEAEDRTPDNSQDVTEEPLFDAFEIEDEEAAPEEAKSDDTPDVDFEEEADNEEETVDPEPEEDVDVKEIPAEEQNPDVIEMRKMFPFLAPLDQQKPTSQPASDAEPELTVPVEESNDDPMDEVPFDEPVQVKMPATSLVPQNEKKSPKKKDKPDYSDYKFPPLDLLAKQDKSASENIQAEIQENADKLIETLADFGVTASIKGVDRGPRITRYEVVPAKGVKVSSILGLQDDIALTLAAGSIRMEAPIPGKSAVGIEIPNKKSSIVRLRDLIETPDFEGNKSKTSVCIGRDVAGQPVFGDLAKMPHLLIAGATGMGKSVCINSLLISILYKAKPDEVKLIMIDPKQVEFTMYNGIPHLLVPVVSDAKQAAGALMWAVDEMERRYNLLNSVCSKSVDSYNEKVTADPSLGDPLPKIIIVIDEFADLMLQVKDPVEQLVTRIAQKARAAGIHLVIGTQRPSVNVITGVIKANVPSRISCKVMSNVDSKTILDSAGADKLLDKGDALYAPAGSAKPHRLQCAYVDESEVEVIMNFLKNESNGESYDPGVMEDIERAAQKCSKKGDRDDGDREESSGEGYLNDRQFLDAVEIAVNTRKISTSLIQRKMSIGYGKAAKFIDIMEDMGIVGEANGQRPREVLLTPDEWREKLARASLD